QQSSPGKSFRGSSECSDIFLVLWQLLIYFLRTCTDSLVRVFFLSWAEGGDMQNQQQFDSMSNMSGETLTPPNEHQSNTYPHEQTPTQDYTSRSYEQGYEQAGLDERDFWARDSEKLRPEPKNQKGMGGLLALIVLLCAGF